MKVVKMSTLNERNDQGCLRIMASLTFSCFYSASIWKGIFLEDIFQRNAII